MLDASMLVGRWWRWINEIRLYGVPVWRWALGALAVLIFALGFYRAVAEQYQGTNSTDFYSYYQAALAVRAGVNPFAPVAAWIASYQPGQAFIASYYVYTPIFAYLLTPLTFLPYEAARLTWEVLNALFIFGTIYALLRIAGKRPTALAVLVLGTAASLLAIVRLEFNWGQADILLLFLLALAFWARRDEHPVLAGLLLALACATKPQLLVFVPYLLWKREYRFAAVAVGAFVGFVFVPFALLGGDALRDQFAVWSFWSNTYVSFIDNQSPKGVLARLFTVNPNTQPLAVAPWLVTALWLALAVVVVALVVAYVRPRRFQADVRTLLEVGLVTSAMLLISPLTEYIYLTLLVVPLVALYLFARDHWHAADGEGRAVRIVTVGAAVLWALLCLPLHNIEYDLWPKMLGGSPAMPLYVLLAVPYLYVVVAVFALNLYALQREDRTEAAARAEPPQTLSARLVSIPRDVYAWLAQVRKDGQSAAIWLKKVFPVTNEQPKS